LLCLPKAFIGPVQSLLQSCERQSHVIFATVLAGVIDISVAWLLIPAHGAVGACIGSGVAQIAAVGLMWGVGIRLYGIKLPWGQIAKITTISLLAAAVARAASMVFRPLAAILVGGSVSLVTLFVLFYALRVLQPEDQARFNVLNAMLPKRIAKVTDKLVSVLIRPEVAHAEASNV
jgi:O-antigen/teichoic acid export membrane protein